MRDASPHTSPVYWRSLDELANTPAFQQFAAAEFTVAWDRYSAGRASRRDFLKLAGASLALAGLTACRWPKENIVPATRQPGNRLPGVPVQYATAIELAGVATGLLVTSYDGRPIKMEGNEKHPFSRGKTNHWMQASVLDLYDPDRSQQPAERVGAASGQAVEASQARYRNWDEFQAFARSRFAQLRANGGGGLFILSEASSSPSLADMKARLLRTCPKAEWYEYEPLSRDNEREGARLAFGKPCRTHLHLDQADVIVSLDSDFLMTHPAAVKYAADFAARRRADGGMMNRLHVVESNLSVTGSMADHRHPVRASRVLLVAWQLAAELVKQGLPLPKAAEGMRSRLEDSGRVATRFPFVEALARDLTQVQGRAAVVAGPRQSPLVHALAHLMNEALGNVGRAITYTDEADPERVTHAAAITALAEGIDAGRVTTLLILGGNPAYDAGALAFDKRLSKVNTSLHLSPYDNETSQRCTWHVPQAHYLEAWGDARAFDGTVSIVQPLIEPLYGGLTALEVLAIAVGDECEKGYDIVRRTFQSHFAGSGDFETAWRQALHDGVVPDTRWAEQPVRWVTADWLKLLDLMSFDESSMRRLGWVPLDEAAFEVVLAQDYSTYDGRFGNNAWLQEMPDPITKLTWDNAALISPADAAKLGVKTCGDVVKIELDGLSIELPAYILPGHAEGSLTLPVGYGRGAAGGRVADGAGVDVFKLRASAVSYIAGAAKVTATGRHYDLATTQDHHSIQSKIGDEETQRRVPVLVREATLAYYKDHPDFAQHVVHHPPLESMWKEKEYKDHKWGMAIDLSACIGCGACVVACQAENNVPVVGKDEVARGREMHWIRIDRYFREARPRGQTVNGEAAHAEQPSDPPSVTVVHQPVACAHCEMAPCEQVCPVAATVHDAEGLNVMVYNRCIGTRYCSNNCPFKVRRFNWFYNHHGPAHPRSVKSGVTPLPGLLQHEKLTEIEKMGHNPNVTVRSRGVMEKCTYCVQRINAVKIQAQNEHWANIPDGKIVPACAQACPTDAIVFGDLNDPNSRVRKLQDHERAYAMLEELNIKPRTKYLAKLRNPAETSA